MQNTTTTTEWAVQRRLYIDQGWEESDTDVRPWDGARSWTEIQARMKVDIYNHYAPRQDEDTTGLPYARVVKREVTDWKPA